jgi:phenylacetate-CoA ligase
MTVLADPIAALQLRRLRATVARAGLGTSIDTLEDLQTLPFTTKDDLRAAYPLGATTVSRDQIARLHASSGTTGKPTVVAHTHADLDRWADLMADALADAGVEPGMTVFNAHPYGLTTGGFGFQQGAERLGATVIPAAGAPLATQTDLICDLQVDVLFCTPSYAVQLAEALDGRTHALTLGLFGGEPWTEALRDRLEAALGIRALDSYGLSEIVGPGVATECLRGRAGLHVADEHFLAEVVHPATGEPLAPGALGELVITTLTREAMPLVRYRTGDITSLTHEPCACGRTTARIGRVAGRSASVLIGRTGGFFPSQVERVLLREPMASPHHQLVNGRTITLRCEPVDAHVDRAALAARLTDAMAAFGIDVQVEPAGTLPRSPGKATRVVDA